MSVNSIWNVIELLATALDGDRVASEETINRLEQELKQLSQRRRDEMRRMLVQIVAGLSRLEVRMSESEGRPN
jgi:hypothetical protein